jgi:hypothetical protein
MKLVVNVAKMIEYQPQEETEKQMEVCQCCHDQTQDEGS